MVLFSSFFKTINPNILLPTNFFKKKKREKTAIILCTLLMEGLIMFPRTKPTLPCPSKLSLLIHFCPYLIEILAHCEVRLCEHPHSQAVFLRN